MSQTIVGLETVRLASASIVGLGVRTVQTRAVTTQG